MNVGTAPTIQTVKMYANVGFFPEVFLKGCSGCGVDPSSFRILIIRFSTSVPDIENVAGLGVFLFVYAHCSRSNLPDT
jgi:hypothetical protein